MRGYTIYDLDQINFERVNTVTGTTDLHVVKLMSRRAQSNTQKARPDIEAKLTQTLEREIACELPIVREESSTTTQAGKTFVLSFANGCTRR